LVVGVGYSVVGWQFRQQLLGIVLRTDNEQLTTRRAWSKEVQNNQNLTGNQSFA
jgi:hypothetical protein